MSRVLKERIKNLIISILIVMGILQVGILLGYQSQWTPTDFIFGLFKPLQISDTDTAREKLFTPNRLILSDGVKFCIIGKDNDIYKSLWTETQNDLSNIVTGTVSLKSSSENWDKLIEKKGIIIDFSYSIKPAFLKWFLGVTEMGRDLPDIRKILINPNIEDPDTGVIYICDSDEKVYVSDTVIFRTANFDEAFTAISDNNGYRLYNSFRSANIDTIQGAPGDILFVNSGPRYWPYYEYNCRIPAKAEKSDELAMIVLGNEKDRYNKSKNNAEMIQFEYVNNIYRLYPDGSLTYQYLGTTVSSGKDAIGSALLNAYIFVNRINQLSDTAADIVLTDIEETNQGIFDISFDYYLKGMPVRLGTDVQVESGGKQLVHAINITADSKRVLTCEWLLRDFTQSGKHDYNDRFTELMSLTGLTFDEIKTMKINNVITGYSIKSKSDEKLVPNMMIEFKDKKMVQIEMPVEKGD
jgi:hypothetical protein